MIEGGPRPHKYECVGWASCPSAVLLFELKLYRACSTSHVPSPLRVSADLRAPESSFELRKRPLEDKSNNIQNAVSDAGTLPVP